MDVTKELVCFSFCFRINW